MIFIFIHDTTTSINLIRCQWQRMSGRRSTTVEGSLLVMDAVTPNTNLNYSILYRNIITLAMYLSNNVRKSLILVLAVLQLLAVNTVFVYAANATEVGQDIGDGLKDAGETIADGATTAAEATANGVTTAAEATANGVTTAAEATADAAKGVAAGVSAAIPAQMIFGSMVAVLCYAMFSA
jgi:hypothetical protein